MDLRDRDIRSHGVVEMSRIRELAEQIGREFHPDKIILFGSYGRGEPTPDSDVDLLVVMPHQGKNWRVAAKIRGRSRAEFPLDLLVRTPEQMAGRISAGDPFLQEIEKAGLVLYANRHT